MPGVVYQSLQVGQRVWVVRFRQRHINSTPVAVRESGLFGDRLVRRGPGLLELPRLDQQSRPQRVQLGVAADRLLGLVDALQGRVVTSHQAVVVDVLEDQARVTRELAAEAV